MELPIFGFPYTYTAELYVNVFKEDLSMSKKLMEELEFAIQDCSDRAKSSYKYAQILSNLGYER
jgi:hypothetical protein